MTAVFCFALLTLLGVGWLTALVVVWRWLRREVGSPRMPDEIPDLDWAELAYLADGPDRVFQAAAVWAVRHGYAAYAADSQRLQPLAPLPADAPTAARTLLAGIDPNLPALATRGRISADLGVQFAHLEGCRLVVPRSRRLIRHAVGFGQFLLSVACFVCAGGLCSRVGGEIGPDGAFATFLVVGVVGMLLALLSVLICNMAQRAAGRLTERGREVLAEYQARRWPGRRWFQVFGPVPYTETDPASAVALFGVWVMANTRWEFLADGIAPPNVD